MRHAPISIGAALKRLLADLSVRNEVTAEALMQGRGYEMQLSEVQMTVCRMLKRKLR